MDFKNGQVNEVRQAMECLSLALLRCRPDGSLVGVTAAAADLLGYSSVEESLEVGRTPARVWERPEEVASWLSRDIAAEASLREFTIRRNDESLLPLALYRPFPQPKEDVVTLLAMDASEVVTKQGRRVLTARLESIGSSCGAIGHKLNNLLAGLFGYTALLRRALSNESETVLRYLDSLDETGHRVHDLTKHLMVIAQKNISYSMQPLEPEALVRAAVERSQEIKPELPVTFEEPADIPKVEADKRAMRESLEQLIIGAAVVLPGTTEVRTALRVEDVDENTARFLGIRSAPYVVVSICHEHTPVQEAARERLFDPYFTCDGKGKGAELNLGKAWGIIALHEGTLTVTPTGAAGTQIEVFLPVMRGKAPAA